ncbi:MAG: hypothetical protein WCL71_04110, partial [Deltaproteobacteria bacterium]
MKPFLRLLTNIATHETAKAAGLFIIFICCMYSQVVFGGRSLLSCLYYPEQCNPPSYSGVKPINVFNIDLGTPAFYEMPVNELIGNMYKKNELPLWNPYQACGTPLAAQYSSRAFFPYQILENISPWWLWDYYMLGRLFLAGFLTYIFLRYINASFYASMLGGIFYMFSGSLTWFINLEQFANVAITIPLFLYLLERLHKHRNMHSAAIAALGLFCVLSAGQPEIALYVIFVGSAYYAFRVKNCVKGYLMFGVMTALGVGLSLPVILPFLEFVSQCFTPHPFMPTQAEHMGAISPTSVSMGISLVLPAIFQIPTYFRLFPGNGVWDYLGGYTLLTCLYFSFSGLASKHSEKKPLLLFFFLFGFSILLKNFGVLPFTLLGELPFFNQAWSPRWAGCIWVFCLSVAGALGFDLAKIETGNKIRYILLPAVILLMAVYLLYIKSDLWQSLLNTPSDFKDFASLFVIANLLVALVVIFSSAVFLYYFRNKKFFPIAIIILALGEAWFYIPKGFDSNGVRASMFLLIIFIPLGIIFIIYNQTVKAILTASSIFIVLSLWLNLETRFAFPARTSPFPEQPFITFLKNNAGCYRCIGTETLLYPNFSSAYGLFDIRFINSISIKTYQNYVNQYLLDDKYYRGWGPAARLWYTGMPISGDTRFIYQDIINRLKFYSL